MIRLTMPVSDFAHQFAEMTDGEQTELLEELLATAGAHAYQAVANYLRENPAETERCPRCGVITFKGGPKGTTCHKCRNHWSPS